MVVIVVVVDSSSPNSGTLRGSDKLLKECEMHPWIPDLVYLRFPAPKTQKCCKKYCFFCPELRNAIKCNAIFVLSSEML